MTLVWRGSFAYMTYQNGPLARVGHRWPVGEKGLRWSEKWRHFVTLTWRTGIPRAGVGHHWLVKGKDRRLRSQAQGVSSAIKNHHVNSGFKKNEFFQQSKNPSSSIIANRQRTEIGVKGKMIYRDLKGLVSRDFQLMNEELNEVDELMNERYPIISLEKIIF